MKSSKRKQPARMGARQEEAVIPGWRRCRGGCRALIAESVGRYCPRCREVWRRRYERSTAYPVTFDDWSELPDG